MILSLDTGTTSMRGILFDERGRAVFTSQKTTSPRFPDTIRVEQDPLAWKQSLLEILSDCSRHLSEKGESLEGISLTAFRSPVFPADREGETRLCPPLCGRTGEQKAFVRNWAERAAGSTAKQDSPCPLYSLQSRCCGSKGTVRK